MSHLNRKLAVGALPVLLLLCSCTSSGPQAPEVTLSRVDPYLITPLDGYPLTAGQELEERIEEAYGGVRSGRPPEEIEIAGRALAAEDPGFHPAKVLLAQVEYLRRSDQAAIALLRPVVDELPDYAAAQLLLGRVSERSGDLPAALESFSRASNELAERRAEEIRPRAIEIVANRLAAEIDRGRIESAEAHLSWLERWGHGHRETLEGTRLVALEKGDLETELAVVRQLAETSADRALLERLGHLEIDIGDVRAGLEQFERLTRQYPDDPLLGEQLERAKFIRRLQLLPPNVQETGRKGELNRADFATLLYWLVPQVRYSQISNPPIAADILDHSQRDEILRVLNLGLMEVDETLHRFDPEVPATRLVVLRALLALLAASPQELSCLTQPATPVDRSHYTVCREAAQCRLIPEAADCLPSASISGAGALELFRLSLDLLGARR